MDRDKTRSFTRGAERDLASIRSSLVIMAQTGDVSDLALGRSDLARLHQEALDVSLNDVAISIANVVTGLDALSSSPEPTRNDAFAVLDKIALAEASLWKAPLGEGEFLDDVSDFVDSSFNQIAPTPVAPREEIAFEIDDETLDIFRSEADELLDNISRGTEILKNSPGDQEALWEIRRSSHTLKGAAGILGLDDAAKIAHRMEDLLDRMVEERLQMVPAVTDLFERSAACLRSIASGESPENINALEPLHTAAIAALSFTAEDLAQPVPGVVNSSIGLAVTKVALVQSPPSPIVRVSLDRLDALITISRSLLSSQNALEDQAVQIAPGSISGTMDLMSLLERHRSLTDELYSKLLGIRMVRFGTLETRLTRTVNMTCGDEKKKAKIELENPETEVDTQMMDALIEPLLHLLKNAVVHGIESPETRRMIGKPECGSIKVRIDADREAVALSVEDDGAGISALRLRDKAIERGLLDTSSAKALSDRDALRLIFERGLTTAEKLDLNAGRGVGMSIVKESVESRGGSVIVESEPQRGTTFTLLMPLSAESIQPEDIVPAAQSTDAGSPLVLIVDDSASIRRHASKIVENAGLRVITANNGADALELLLNGSFEPDLILSDVEMPQIDGWELLAYIKTDENLGHIPVVLVTSLDAERHRKKANELGSSDYLVKPFTDEALTRILSKLEIQVSA